MQNNLKNLKNLTKDVVIIALSFALVWQSYVNAIRLGNTVTFEWLFKLVRVTPFISIAIFYVFTAILLLEITMIICKCIRGYHEYKTKKK